VVLLQRLQQIKWIFIALFFFNLLFVCTGLVFSVYYYQNHSKYTHDYNSTVDANTQTFQLIQSLNDMKSADTKPDKLAQAEWLVQLRNHPQYKEHTFLKSHFEKFNQLPLSKYLDLHSKEFTQSGLQLVQSNMETIQMEKRHFRRLNTLLVTSIVTSLLLGILLPLFLFHLAGKTLKAGYSLAKESVRDWTKEWKKDLESHGDKPFHNPAFWSKVGLTTAEIAIRHHRHPAIVVTHDILSIVKDEVSRNETTKDQNNAKKEDEAEDDQDAGRNRLKPM